MTRLQKNGSTKTDTLGVHGRNERRDYSGAYRFLFTLQGEVYFSDLAEGIRRSGGKTPKKALITVTDETTGEKIEFHAVKVAWSLL